MLRLRNDKILLLLVGCLVTGCSGAIEGEIAGKVPDSDGKKNEDGTVTEPDRVTPSFTCDKDKPAGEVRMRRLTKVQYENTVRDLVTFALGDATAAGTAMSQIKTAMANVPSEGRALSPRSPIHGTFRRASQDVLQEHTDAYYGVGMAIGAALTSSGNLPRILGSCATQANAGQCIDSFIERFGQRALRRPLDAAEKTSFRSIYGNGTAVDAAALGDTITVILNNPAFVFQVEHAAGSTPADKTFTLSNFELANRLSYHFWQTMPDDSLWQAALAGSLNTKDGYDSQVERLFNDPRTAVTMDTFIDEWLRLEGVKTLDPTKAGAAEKKFAAGVTLSSDLQKNMRTEIVDLARHLIFEKNASVRDLLTTDLSFAKTDDLRSIYGVAGSAPQALPGGKRPGLFTRAAFLSNGSIRTRPVMKGVFLRTEILCDELPAPPDNAANAKVDGDTTQMTTRAQIEALTEVKGSACASCHSALINPLGFATENFDALGRERTEEKFFDQSGNQIGAKPVSTEANAAVSSDTEAPVSGGAELMSRIADSGKVEACMARQYFRFAFARWEDEARDGCALEEMRQAASSGPVKDLLKRIAMTNGFKQRTFE